MTASAEALSATITLVPEALQELVAAVLETSPIVSGERPERAPAAPVGLEVDERDHAALRDVGRGLEADVVMVQKIGKRQMNAQRMSAP